MKTIHHSTPDEDFTNRLRKLTPDVSGLDVTALAFQAGQRSVRTRRAWPTLAGLLATTQAVTLLLWLSPTVEPPPSAMPNTQPVVVEPLPTPSGASPYSYAALREVVAGRSDWPEPTRSDDVRRDRPNLTARSSLSDWDFD